MLNLLTDVAGITVGHATDLTLGTGATAILFDAPATVAVATLGGAPGSRDTAMLEPEMTRQQIDGVMLSGGSVYGLDAPGGAQAALREAGRGFRLRGALVPLISGAIVFDLLNGAPKDWGTFSPYRDLGYTATKAARPGAFALGTVGAGTGATTATVKGGVGSASARTSTGHVVAALAVVNAVGAPTIGDGPHFWAAPYEVGDEYGARGWPARIAPADVAPRMKGLPPPATATTIGIVATDAVLTKGQCKRLAIMANDGLARAILPAHAPGDGDTVFAAATGARPLAQEEDLALLGHAATLVFARACARGCYAATTPPWSGGQRSWRDRFA
ncbi:MAG: P1 family peptidase [Alphaproteobacteria bacterium]|nr:P1 family peptidase [Alphaproteobacteria bacterium]